MGLPLIQNFSVPAGNSISIDFELPPPDDQIHAGFDVIFKVYAQQYGVPLFPLQVLITKSLLGGGITLGTPPISFTVTLVGADTITLLKNYYHEESIVDPSGGTLTSAQGIMTVTPTEN